MNKLALLTTAAPVALPGAAMPRFVSIPRWVALTGISRSTTYIHLAAGSLKAVKLGGRTMIDAEAGMQWLASLPSAEIKMPSWMRRQGATGAEVAAAA